MHINNTFFGGWTSSASNARQNTGSSLNGTANSATEDEQTHEVYLRGSASLPSVIYDKIHKVTFSKNLHIYMACVNWIVLLNFKVMGSMHLEMEGYLQVVNMST
jgi:hypothetical protein